MGRVPAFFDRSRRSLVAAWTLLLLCCASRGWGATEGPSLAPAITSTAAIADDAVQGEAAASEIDGLPDAASVVESTAPAPAAEAGVSQPDCALWVVSTRGVSDSAACRGGLNVRVRRCEGRQWRHSSLDEFLATDDPSVITTIFVHGNDTSDETALGEGSTIYRRLCRAHCHGTRLRMVIWSWPSDRVVTTILQNAERKACRTRIESILLARFVDRIGADVPISVLGYSYGARALSGMLHLLGGGQVAGVALEYRLHPDRMPLRAVFWAAAVDEHGLYAGRSHGLAMTQVDRLVLTVNPRDIVLHFYPLMFGRGGPDALGNTGLSAQGLVEGAGEVVNFSVRGLIGRRHDWSAYTESSPIMNRTSCELLFLTGPRQ